MIDQLEIKKKTINTDCTNRNACLSYTRNLYNSVQSSLRNAVDKAEAREKKP